MPKETKLTLCERCLKATGGCSWADRFEDVPGWTADVTVILSVHKASGESFESRLVHDCPEFIPDDRSWLEHPNREGIELLAANVIKLAVHDWLRYEGERPDIERFLFSKYFEDLTDLDPRALLRLMRQELEERRAGKKSRKHSGGGNKKARREGL